MSGISVRDAVGEHFQRIINSPVATKIEFLDLLIERLQLHRLRMLQLRGESLVDFDSLPSVKVFGQTGVTLRFASDRFYIVQSSASPHAHVQLPKVTTLRATPEELLQYIREGHAKTEDFLLHVVNQEGVMHVECVEISIIDQNDTVFAQPVHVLKGELEQKLRTITGQE